MTLRHLKIFLAICDTGSTTAAGEQLHIAQPTVSIALRELEEHYGVPMFERYARRLMVTQAGRELYQYAKHLIALYDETEDAMKSMSAAGTLRVGSSITIGTCFLPAYVRQFQILCPQTKILAVVENTETIEHLILENQVDIGLVEGRVRSPFLEVKPYCQDWLVMVCSPHHPFAHYASVRPEELTAETLLLRERGSAVRETFETLMAARGVKVQPIWQSVSTQAIIQAVRAELGVSVLPWHLVREEVEKGLLAAVPVQDVDFTRYFSIIYHKNKVHSRAFRCFMELCESMAAGDGADFRGEEALPLAEAH